MSFFDGFLFIALPYLAVGVFLVGFVRRYMRKGFQVSSLSSQFLEGKQLFWGSLPFHVGILVVFLGHLLAFLIPSSILLWNGDPLRLLALEITGFAFGLSFLIGLSLLFYRRITNARIRMVTNEMDILIEVLLLTQVVLGLWIALFNRWGSSWFASDLSPYLWSILAFRPDPEAVLAMPTSVQLHIINAFLILLVLPFTRLVHLLVAPFHYIGRPYQRVIWNWDRKKIRNPDTRWSPTRPKNN